MSGSHTCPLSRLIVIPYGFETLRIRSSRISIMSFIVLMSYFIPPAHARRGMPA
jgi:hypothetical protein